VLELPKGPGYAYSHRNRAVERARGDVVAWLGDDDLWLPDHLEHVGELFDATGAGLVQAPVIKVDERDVYWWHALDWRIPELRRDLAAGIGQGLSSISHRTELAARAGGWRDDKPRAGDGDVWTRMLNAGVSSAMTGTPSVLRFAGTGRRQSPVERVAQNRRFLEMTATPSGMARVRSEAARGAGRELAERRAQVRELFVSRDETARELERAQQHVHELYLELDRLRKSRRWPGAARLRLRRQWA
jgi:glycosyltransferase involved in cell wall biosynthesis